MKAAILVVLAALNLPCEPAWSETTPRPSFETASVRANTETGGAIRRIPQRSGNRVTWRNVTLAQVAYYAYRITSPADQVKGSLELSSGHNYDIEATVAGSPDDEKIRLMFQTLLEDRFKLRVHREAKEQWGYDLVTAKGGWKLKAPRTDTEIAVDGKPRNNGDTIWSPRRVAGS